VLEAWRELHWLEDEMPEYIGSRLVDVEGKGKSIRVFYLKAFLTAHEPYPVEKRNEL